MLSVARRLMIVLLLVLSACSGAPPTVDRIEIVNPTGYDLTVEVSGEEQPGWLPLSVVEPGSSATVREVIDQGERWRFRFRHFGETVGEISLDRDELESSQWRVDIPPEVGDRLAGE
ncbi:MAG TPA: hypothetical protein VG602_06195 [Actinomycetota bacterium]|nr:hypothetical protein [Actinomycetota bacterium]